MGWVSPTPPDIAIRAASQADAPELAWLLAEIGWFSALEGMSRDELVASIRRQLGVLEGSTTTTTLVVETADGSLVGYCNVHWLTELFMPGPEGYVSELFLIPESRGRGIGTALLERILIEATERGVYRLMLLNRKDRESYERGFYLKYGWEERPGMANFVYFVGKPDPSAVTPAGP